MSELDEARRVIDRVDRGMADLFSERMEAVRAVAEYKAEHGLPVFDPARETELIARESGYVAEELRPYYVSFLRAAIAESKKYQTAKLSSAVPGAEVLTVPTGAGSYPVYIGAGLLGRAAEFLPRTGKALIVTDDGVPREYAQAVASAVPAPTVAVLPQGEGSKCGERLSGLLRTMLDAGFTRGDCVIAVGGGVVGDTAGFAAALYMRGIGFYNVPTTLLAQVDSSVGGKVAVDFGGVKNAVGAFYPPSGVLIDTDVLKTLDKRQYACGMAEAVKTFAAADARTFERLEREDVPVADVIAAALKIKTAVVTADEKETGLRRVLNFGHTVGHALEAALAGEENALLHGECVAVGMVAVTGGETRERLIRLLGKFGLPTRARVNEAAFSAALSHDKKSENDGIVTVEVPEIGNYCLQKRSVSEIFDKSREVLEFR